MQLYFIRSFLGSTDFSQSESSIYPSPQLTGYQQSNGSFLLYSSCQFQPSFLSHNTPYQPVNGESRSYVTKPRWL